MFLATFKGDSSKLQSYLKCSQKMSSGFQENFKGVSREFLECFEGVSRDF